MRFPRLESSHRSLSFYLLTFPVLVFLTDIYDCAKGH
jgi:hypothetical protein